MSGWSSKPDWPMMPVREISSEEFKNKYPTGSVIAEMQAQATDPISSLIQETGRLLIEAIPKVYDNLKPTHDPYTNPDAHIYYECDCGAILDPGTKSFAQLNNHASEKGWKVRWHQNGQGYQPFCVECGKDVS